MPDPLPSETSGAAGPAPLFGTWRRAYAAVAAAFAAQVALLWALTRWFS